MTAPALLTAYFRSGDALRSRSVGGAVRHAVLALPPLPAPVLADWTREVAELGLEAGDVEPLRLARARLRWPDHRACLQAMAGWAQALGLGDLLADSDIAPVALMACRGARYHHDAAQYAGAAFANLFVGDDKGLDVHFPHTGQRIPLVRGTALLFDTGQPHAVVGRGTNGFDAADFGAASDCSQFFLTWELPIEDTRVAQALGITFDTDSETAATLHEQQVLVDGAPAVLCAATGAWV